MTDAVDNSILRAYVDDLCARLTSQPAPRPVWDQDSYFKHRDIRETAAAEIEALSDPRLIPVLQAKLAEKLSADDAATAYRCLCHLVENVRHRPGADYLLRALSAARQTSRLVILRRMAHFVLLCDADEAFRIVHPYLESESYEVRTAAASVLGRLGHPQSITALLQYLQSAVKQEDFHAALMALEACGDATLLPYTLDYAYSSHGKAYWPAITCISSWLRADATPFLVSVLERQRSNKEIAVKELAKWGDERALPQVTRRVKAQVKKLVQGGQRIPWDLTDGIKYLKRFRGQSCFDELNAQLVTFIQGLPEHVVHSLGRHARADLLGLLEPESG